MDDLEATLTHLGGLNGAPDGPGSKHHRSEREVGWKDGVLGNWQQDRVGVVGCSVIEPRSDVSRKSE